MSVRNELKNPGIIFIQCQALAVLIFQIQQMVLNRFKMPAERIKFLAAFSKIELEHHGLNLLTTQTSRIIYAQPN